MAYVSSKQLDRSREIFAAVVNAAIDRVCGLITKRQWDEIKFAGCLADCDPMFSAQASRDLLTARLDQLQYTSATLEDIRATVTYSRRQDGAERLAPTDKAGRSIEHVYAPVRIELTRSRELVVQWQHFGMVDTREPLASEIQRLQRLVDIGELSREQMVEAVSDATASLGVSLR